MAVSPRALQETTPPTVAVVSVGSGGQNSGASTFAPSIARRRSIRVVPGSTVMTHVPSSRRWGASARFMRERFMTCPLSGTALPARPVRPPWTVTETRSRRISAMTATISSSLSGNETLSAAPSRRDSSHR